MGHKYILRAEPILLTNASQIGLDKGRITSHAIVFGILRQESPFTGTGGL